MTRVPARFLVAWAALLLVAGACGAEFQTIAGPPSTPDTSATTTATATTTTTTTTTSTSTTTTGEDVEPRVGAFTVAPLSPVTVGDAVGLAVEVQAGGPLSAAVAEGQCRMIEQLVFRANAVGTCTIEVSQREVEGFLPAESQRVRVRVRGRPDLPSGSFTADAPDQVSVGDEIEVATTVKAGGSLVVTSLTDNCPRSGSVFDRSVFDAVEAGECRLQVSQRATAGHRSGPAVVLTVDIAEPPAASLDVQAPRSADTESVFQISAVRVVGADGPAEFRLSGGCLFRTAGSTGPVSAPPGTPIDVLADDEIGSCTVTARIDSAEGYGPAEPALAVVQITKRQGSFTVRHPEQVQIGARFTLAATNVVGGNVTIARTAGPCRQPIAAAPTSVVVGTGAGTCTFLASQADTANVAAQDPLSFSVRVVKKVYVITLSAPASADIYEEFHVGIKFPSDAPSELIRSMSISYTGPCEDYYSSEFYGTDNGQCVFTLKDVETDTYRTQTKGATVRITDPPTPDPPTPDPPTPDPPTPDPLTPDPPTPDPPTPDPPTPDPPTPDPPTPDPPTPDPPPIIDAGSSDLQPFLPANTGLREVS